MSSLNLLASIAMACLLAVGLLGIASVANAEPGGPSLLKLAKSANTSLIEIKGRRRGPRIHLPLGPGSIYYDYPYYYSRGYYPTHIGGYVYYPSRYHRNYYPRYGGRCPTWHRGCRRARGN